MQEFEALGEVVSALGEKANEVGGQRLARYIEARHGMRQQIAWLSNGAKWATCAHA